MKVIEVQFDGHVRMPGSQRTTNVLRTLKDNKLGNSVLVDAISEDDVGVVATKTIEKDNVLTTYRKRYPWVSVAEVIYEPEVLSLEVKKK